MTENHSGQNSGPVDAVVLWVDGSDPVLTGKRSRYLQEAGAAGLHGTRSTYFASFNEIRYCVLSILKFASFVRNIFIVTDGQDPDLYDEVKTYFPEKSDSIKIVDHKEIFRGFEKFLPSFNSMSIESMVWRIRGLSENFIYFNDDLFLTRYIVPEDWFANNHPVLIGRWRLPPYRIKLGHILKTLINRNIYGDKSYQGGFSFYLWQWNAVLLTGRWFRYFFHCHTPHPLNRIRLEKYYAEHVDLLEKNLVHRFRHPDHYNMISLANHLEILDGNRQFVKPRFGYLHPYYSKNRLERRIRKCDSDPGYKSVCAQNLDLFSDEQRQGILDWMDGILKLPA